MWRLAREAAEGRPAGSLPLLHAPDVGPQPSRGSRPPPCPCHLVDVAVDSGRDVRLSFSDGGKALLRGCQVGTCGEAHNGRHVLLGPG